MASMDEGDQELSDDVLFIKIGKRYWQIRAEVYSIGDDAVENAKMVEIFGDAQRTASARAEGVILGTGSLRKVCVQWTNLVGEPVYQYGYQHKKFRKGDKASAKKKARKTTENGNISGS